MPANADLGPLRKSLLGLYRLACLSSLVAIAVLAFLIYQRLPPTRYEWTHASPSEKKALIDRRWVMGPIDVDGPVEVEGSVEAEVTNTVQAEVTNTVDVQIAR